VSVESTNRGADATLPPPAERLEPLLTVRSRGSLLLADLVTLSWVFTTVLALVAGTAGGVGILQSPTSFTHLPLGVKLGLGAFVIFWATLSWIQRVLNRAIWHVEFHESWVELKLRPWGPTQVGARWEDLLSFDDSESHLVSLHLKDARRIPIQTHDDAERVAVLDFLVKKGVPRREA